MEANNERSTSFANTDVSGISGQAGTASGADKSLMDKTRERARERVQSGLHTGTAAASVAMSSVAQSLLNSSEQLKDQQNGAATLVQQAAERLEDAAQYLESTDLDQVIRGTETWARRNPALFLGGAFLLGVIGARFLKSSAPQPSALVVRQSTFSDREVRTPVAEET